MDAELVLKPVVTRPPLPKVESSVPIRVKRAIANSDGVLPVLVFPATTMSPLAGMSGSGAGERR
jgi:hypothetical protein